MKDDRKTLDKLPGSLCRLIRIRAGLIGTVSTDMATSASISGIQWDMGKLGGDRES